jgi:trans-aconitate 2-methyltransferase
VSQPSGDQSAEWDAEVYHRVSTPQAAWGRAVVDRLPLAGDETVVDAGCGTGMLTAQLLERLPRGQVIAVDRSAAMLAEATAFLTPRFGGRVSFVQANVAELSLPQPVDAIFSTATFHWVRDHPALFRTIYASLRPGGRLVAQCGGGPNIARLRKRAEELFDTTPYRHQGIKWPDPWEFATPEVTARRLRDAGFNEVQTGLEAKPTTFVAGNAYHEFVEHVVLLEHLKVLPDAAARTAFMDELTQMAASDDPPYTLDYWRLNLSARCPASS